MQNPLFSIRHKVHSLLTFTALSVLLIAASACHRAPNLIPYGYDDAFKDAARASTAARVDYPIVVTPNPNDPNAKVDTFRVTKNGERTWFWQDGFWDEPSSGSSNIWYRVHVIYQKEKKLLCSSVWVKPNPKGDVTEITCALDFNSYLAKPLLTILVYGLGADETKPPPDDDVKHGILPRTYYFIPLD